MMSEAGASLQDEAPQLTTEFEEFDSTYLGESAECADVEEFCEESEEFELQELESCTPGILSQAQIFRELANIKRTYLRIVYCGYLLMDRDDGDDHEVVDDESCADVEEFCETPKSSAKRKYQGTGKHQVLARRSAVNSDDDSEYPTIDLCL